MTRLICEAGGGGQLLERAHQQRGRSAAVLSVRVPGSARQLGGDEASVCGEEHGIGMAGHGSATKLHSREMSEQNGTPRDEATFTVKAGLAEMLKGGVIMDVVTPEQAKIAEDAGAAAVMALERVPADIRRDGGVARMSDPSMIKGIQEIVTIPVMAKARIGHFVEAQVLEALEVDYIDESEVLTPADEANHIDKWAFKVPFVCGATNLGEALRRIGEGAAMIRSKGEAGTGDIVEAVRHLRKIRGEIRRLTMLDEAELRDRCQGARRAAAPRRARSPPTGRLPVVLFCAGGIATPGRRLARDAARRRGRVRRLGDLQVRGSRAAGAGDRRGDDALPGSGAGRRGVDRSRPADGQPRDLEARGRAAALAARLVASAGCRRASASSPCRAGSRRTPRSCARSAPSRARSASPADLDGLDALIIPGGESTVMTLGIEREGLAEPLRELIARGTPVLGTCAGLIMLDRDHLGLLDVRAERNAFGRQLRSFEAESSSTLAGGPIHAVFIRAPWVAEHGDDVEVLASVDDHPVAVRQGNVLAVAFHPELAGETRLHELLLSSNGRA